MAYIQKMAADLSFQAVVKAGSVIVALFGFLILVGWKYDVDLLRGGLTAAPLLAKPNVGLCFLLSGIALGLLNINNKRTFVYDKPQNNTLLLALRRLAVAVSGIIALFGGLTLCQYVFGWNLEIDQLLFQESPKTFGTVYPGRMGIPGALNFLILGSVFILLNQKLNHHRIVVAQGFTLLCALIAMQALVGHLYGVKILYGIAPFVMKMALHTSVTFLVLCTGILCLHPNHGLMRRLTSDYMGGWIMRRLLPTVIGIPIVVGGIIAWGQRAGYYHPLFGMTIGVVITIGVFSILIARNAALLDRLDQAHKHAKEALLMAHEQLQQRVEERTAELSHTNLQLQQAISRYQQTENTLRQSQQKLRAIFDGVFQFIGLLTPAGVLIESNRASLSAIAANRDDVIDKFFWDTPWWTGSKNAQTQLKQGIQQAATGKFVRFEINHLVVDGIPLTIDFSLSPVLDDAGNVIMLIPEGRDISTLR